jgi:hypothetical protein
MLNLFFESFFISLVEISDASHIDRHNSDRTRHLSRSKKPISSLEELSEVELEPTTHRANRSRLVGLRILNSSYVSIFIFDSLVLRSDEVLEIWEPILPCHSKYPINCRILPREIFCDVVGWNRKCKCPSSIVTCRIHLDECLIDDRSFTIEFTIFFDISSRIISSEVK